MTDKQCCAACERMARICESVWRDAPNTRESGYLQNKYSHGCIASAKAIADSCRHTAAPDRWVAVGERLPEDSEFVLTVDFSGYQHVKYGKNVRVSWEHRTDSGKSFYTHWMPLPSAPGQPNVSTPDSERGKE